MKRIIKYSLIIYILVSIIVYIKEPIAMTNKVTAIEYKTPANSAFEDDNFYKCIIDTYNSNNKTSLSYDTNLTEEQLQKITSL